MEELRTHGNAREVNERVLADHHLLDQLTVTQLDQLRVVEGGGDLPSWGGEGGEMEERESFTG